MSRCLDITGHVYGRLTAIGLIGLDRRKQAIWLFKCECGTEYKTICAKVRKGDVVSCGCYRKEQRPRLGLKHGLRNTPEYEAWVNLKRRCKNPNNQAYANYGGRGIQVCDEWLNGDGDLTGFECFIRDVGLRPSVKHTIERKDNDGPHSKSNCVWATFFVQANNKRNSRYLSHNGSTRTLKQWAIYFGVSSAAIAYRLRRGWSIDKALGTPFSETKTKSRKPLQIQITDYKAVLTHFRDHPHLHLVVQRLADEEANSQNRKDIPGVKFTETKVAA